MSLPQAESAWPQNLAPMNDVFLIDAKDRAVLEGQAGWTRAGRDGLQTRAAALVILLIAILITLALPVREMSIADRFARTARTAEAQVVRTYTTVSSGRSGRQTHYHLVFAFDLQRSDDSTYRLETETEITWELYRRIAPGQWITIRYLPDEPGQAILADYDPHAAKIPLYLALSAAMGLMCTFMVWLGQRKVNRDRRLVADGVWLKGCIRQSDVRRVNKTMSLVVTYVFTDPQGQQIERTTSQPYGKPEKDALPPPGTPIAVRYVDEHTFEAL